MASDVRRARTAFGATVVLLLLALVAPAVTLLAAWSRDDEQQSTHASSDYPLSSSARTVTVAATAHPTWADPVEVRAPAWSGVVTAVLVAPGSALTSGTPVVRVSGVEIRYATLDSPLHQPVCQGDEVLVEQVRSVLATAGLRTSSSRQLSAVDVTAVRAYASAIGVPDARSVTCFDPAWVLVGSAPVDTVAEVDLQVGAPVPAQGEVVVTGAARLAGVALTGGTGSAAIDAVLAAEDGTVFAETDLLVNGQSLGVAVADLAAAEALAVLGPVLAKDRAGQGDGASTEGSAATGQATSSDTVNVAVLLTLRDSQFLVPATAVVSPVGQQACIVAAGEAVPVTVLSSSVSGLVVDLGTSPAPETVSLAPGEVTCA
ncbi:MAG TPA: hypothetical protein VGC67_15465 [Cellulomonas sp.]